MELLSPAGKPENVYAAVNNGCNAVYLGGKNFNARSSAENFTGNELEQTIDYCHLRGVKVYICLNTLYKNSELNEVMGFAEEMYEKGADAFILQDIGTAQLIRKSFPGISLHASTQMTAHSLDDCLYLQEAGFERIVLSRECTLDDIRNITANITAEIEVFVHGALCVCYSGRCLMSSFIGERSGNRGKCAQPCRLKYNLGGTEGYLLSPKDIMTLSILPQIIDAGVKSLKIEGRMKTPEYTAITARAYSRHIDRALSGERYFVDEESQKELLAAFNRGGSFSEGYFATSPGRGMLSVKTPKSTGVLAGTVLSYNSRRGLCEIQTRTDMIPGDGIVIWTNQEPNPGAYIEKKSPAGHKITVSLKGRGIEKGDLVYKSYDKAIMDKAKKLYEKDERKIEITGNVYANVGEPLKLTLKYGGLEASATGETPQKPENKGVTPEEFLQRLSKTGDTTFNVRYMDNIIDNTFYASMGGINALRREACEGLKDKIIKNAKRESIGYRLDFKAEGADGQKYLTALVKNAEQFHAAAVEGLRRIYVEQDALLEDLDFFIEESHKYNIQIFAALKPISHKDEREVYQRLEASGIDGYLIRTYGQYYQSRSSKKLKTLDYSFNITNSLSSEVLKADFTTLSTELNLEEINAIGGGSSEIVVYGRLPLMITRQCPIGAHLGCNGRQNTEALRDRTGAEFPVETDCSDCRAVIYNSRPIFMLHKFQDILQSDVPYLRMEFTTESGAETSEMVKAHLDRKVGKLLDKLEKNFTNGHFYRGVL